MSRTNLCPQPMRRKNNSFTYLNQIANLKYRSFLQSFFFWHFKIASNRVKRRESLLKTVLDNLWFDKIDENPRASAHSLCSNCDAQASNAVSNKWGVCSYSSQLGHKGEPHFEKSPYFNVYGTLWTAQISQQVIHTYISWIWAHPRWNPNVEKSNTFMFENKWKWSPP